MKSFELNVKIGIFIILCCYNEFIEASCLQFGHSCWGAHGRKRSDIPPRAMRPPPMKLNDRFALIKILPDKLPEEMFQPKSFDRSSDMFEMPNNLARSNQPLLVQPSSEEGSALSDEGGKKLTEVDIKNSIDDLAEDMNYQPHPNINQFYKNNEAAEEPPLQLYHINQRIQKYLN